MTIELHCPHDHKALAAAPGGRLLCPSCSSEYGVVQGIPRFVSKPEDPGQAQVQEGFRFKWTRDAWGFKPEHIRLMRDFFWTRFGFKSDADVANLFKERIVLHAGIGSGQEEQYYLPHCREVWGVDISESVDACRKNWEVNYPDLAPRLRLAQADIMAMPFEDEVFDIVISDGVLHHTPDTFKALAAICAKVKRGGLVIFYVYRKKAPVREFVDDYLRCQVSGLAPEEAWRRLQPLTALARELSRKRIGVEVPQSMPELGLERGEYDLQRWLYWNFMKFYWNEALDFDENNHVNFDWYYPKYAWRHTPDEVREWLRRLEMTIERLHEGESGISVIAGKG